MSTGLVIYNNSSTVQIDNNWRNFGFKQKIPIYFSITLPAVTPYLTYTLTVAGEKAMVAVKSVIFDVIMINSWFDGANYIYNYFLMPPESVGFHEETVEFYVFDVPPPSGFSNVGLVAYDSSGNTVFHTDMNPMKIAGFQGATATFTGVVGRTYVPLIGINPLYISGGRVRGYALNVVGHQIIPVDRQTPKTSISSWSNNGTYAAVDVTGL